ncbi:MAG: cytochrome-c oxidase, cbb3-type subunit III [Rhodobacteraceae bacterium]|jgi:cytochrome c oxidase cbb3-type subunit 3|nr:cytochrome-c oxidase, cbb3-type subunit III [Paracoccaceae bacterium]
MSTTDRKPRPGEPETTGHEWDGIEEYNNPLPAWWLWIFYATIAWSVVYTVLYPAWPLVQRATGGTLGWSTRADVAAEIARFEERNEPLFARLVAADLADIGADDELNRFAVSAGASVFRAQCSQCHGAGAGGVQASGFPNLLDNEWLWGGSIDDILLTVSHGIRNETDPDARYSQMPAFGEMLTAEEIEDIVAHVRRLSSQSHDAARAAAGETLYLDNCASCHGEAGEGDRAQGAPALDNAIWLYGGSEAAIRHTITYSRWGVMPAFADRLREAEIRAVALYVHQLGGGE